MIENFQVRQYYTRTSDLALLVPTFYSYLSHTKSDSDSPDHKILLRWFTN